MRRPRVQKPSRKWRCPWCRRSENGDLGKVMSSKNVLQKHLASAHSDETILFCPSLDCKAFYEGVEKLTDHMRYHEGDGDRCKRIPCIYTNRDYNKMRAHEDCHKKADYTFYNKNSAFVPGNQCTADPQCPHRSPGRKDMCLHVSNVHQQNHEHRCNKCSASYVDIAHLGPHLIKHTRQQHDDLDSYLPLAQKHEEQFTCVFWNFGFNIIGPKALQAATILKRQIVDGFHGLDDSWGTHTPAVKLSLADLPKAIRMLCADGHRVAMYSEIQYGSDPSTLEPDRIYSAGTTEDGLSGHLMALKLEEVTCPSVCAFAVLEQDTFRVGQLACVEELQCILDEIQPKEILVDREVILRGLGVEVSNMVVRVQDFENATVATERLADQTYLRNKASRSASRSAIGVLISFLSESKIWTKLSGTMTVQECERKFTPSAFQDPNLRSCDSQSGLLSQALAPSITAANPVLLRWIEQTAISKETIRRRQHAVKMLLEEPTVLIGVRTALEKMNTSELDCKISRIREDDCNEMDLMALATYLKALRTLQQIILDLGSKGEILVMGKSLPVLDYDTLIKWTEKAPTYSSIRLWRRRAPVLNTRAWLISYHDKLAQALDTVYTIHCLTTITTEAPWYAGTRFKDCLQPPS